MGAGSSVEAAPARMSEEECKQLAGDKFDQAAWDKAEKDADGKVAKEAVISAAAPAAAEAPAAEAPAAEAPAAEAPAAEAPKRKKRLSIVGDVDVAGAGRRNSVLAEATDKAIDAADAADKPKILVDTISKDQETPEGAEFASWALSCGTELCRGNAEARGKLFDANYCDQIVKYLEMYPDDVFVQYQGLHAMGSICEGTGAAEKFGTNGMKLVVTALGDTDMTELALAGISTLTTLCNSAQSNSEYETDDLKATLTTLLEEFKTLNNFKYSAQELLKQLNKEKKFSWEEESGPVESNFTVPAAAAAETQAA